jgi:hypothetical protein
MLLLHCNNDYARGNQYCYTCKLAQLLRIYKNPDLFAEHISMFFYIGMNSVCFAVKAASVHTLHNEGKLNY